jgi:flagellin-like protein
MKLPRFNEEAVSPVIGVILMVAIVVILAAVVWVAVAPMADENLQSAKIVKLTVSPDRTTGVAEVVVAGGSGLSQVSDIYYTVDGGSNSVLWATKPNIGDMNSTNADVTAGKRFMILANFTDGSQQILYDKEI